MFNESMHGLMSANYSENHWMSAYHGPVSWIVWFLILLAIGMVISRIWHGGHRHSARNNALDILGQRFANGEIDENEYREKRTVLKSRH